MASDSAGSLEKEVSNLSSNLAPMVILTVFILLPLFWFWWPWGMDPVYSPLHHFLTVFPLALLALVTYVAHEKINEAEESSG
ncbi:DUF6684 family protein [Haloarcula nitratireducens]|uniref:Cox cluster protein n=1 Tax=Haloarcula nitratireducens TaxID=2487749 RepID=A0AAW4PF98_9EURY|nr:DUF6684 family protein [Halomicroarcula nitratireducens]MBX0296732.1 hypothetical protein [Halomicroarcula nitratireducens]